MLGEGEAGEDRHRGESEDEQDSRDRGRTGIPAQEPSQVVGGHDRDGSLRGAVGPQRLHPAKDERRTPTEALAALKAGASGLKFFPASVLGPSGIAAIKAVLPAGIEIGAVGGVSDKDFPAYAAAGIRTFGLGSSLYRPGITAAEVRARARTTIAAYDAVYGGHTAMPRAFG